MKKLALLAATITLMGISANCFAAAEATVLLNNFDSGNTILFLATGSTGAGKDATAANGVSVQLMGGPSATQLQPVVPTTGGSAVIPVAGAAAGGAAGYFDGGVGVVPGVAPLATATFQLWAFTGSTPSATYASATWTQPTGSWDPAAQPPAPPGGPSLQNPKGLTVGGTVIPEPSTIALGVLGLGALLIRRRH